MSSTIDSILNLPGGSQAVVPDNSPSSEIDQEGFLTLLVAQLQNQDPLEPISNEEFVQQLTSFSSLDELRGINGNLDGLGELGNISELLTAGLAMQQANLNASAVSLIGQEVEAVTDGVVLGTGKPAEIGIMLPETATETITLALKSISGETLFEQEIDLSDPPAGVRIDKNTAYIEVPTENNSGQALPNGVAQIVATGGSEGGALTTTLLGLVDGIDFRDGATLMTVSGTRIDLGNVLEISSETEE
jgi:flagellar basal-body rod modification protein FlgD